MKKIIMLVFALFLFTGCKVEYELTINKDLTVLESTNMTGTEEFFEIYYKTSRLNVIKMMLENTGENLLKNNNYDYELFEGAIPFVLATKEYKDLNDFCDNTIFFEQYFDDITCSEANGILSLKTGNFKPNDPEDPNRFNINNARITFVSNYSIVDNNASIINKDENSYTWLVGEDTEELSISLSLDTNKEFVKENSDNYYIIIIVTIAVVVLMWIVFYIVNKYKKAKKNKNDD